MVMYGKAEKQEYYGQIFVKESNKVEKKKFYDSELINYIFRSACRSPLPGFFRFFLKFTS